MCRRRRWWLGCRRRRSWLRSAGAGGWRRRWSDGRAVVDVELGAVDFGVELARGFVEGFLAPGEDDDLAGAGSGEGLGHGEADAAGTTADDDGFTGGRVGRVGGVDGGVFGVVGCAGEVANWDGGHGCWCIYGVVLL